MNNIRETLGNISYIKYNKPANVVHSITFSMIYFLKINSTF